MKRMIWALLPLLLLSVEQPLEQPLEKLLCWGGCSSGCGNGLGNGMEGADGRRCAEDQRCAEVVFPLGGGGGKYGNGLGNGMESAKFAEGVSPLGGGGGKYGNGLGNGMESAEGRRCAESQRSAEGVSPLGGGGGKYGNGLGTDIQEIYNHLLNLLSPTPTLKRAKPSPPAADTLRFIFMGHGYDWKGGNAKVDPRLEVLDYSKYHRIMLGGDMCSEAFAYKSTLIYLDSLFDLDNPRTHYALGNHEARNESHEWFEEITGHKTYATHSEFGVTVFTLNTTLNPGDCEELDAQFRMLKNICDTIQVSSHLIIIQHHGVWKNVPGLSSNQLTYSNWAYPYWDANCFEDSTLYYQSIYPMLVKVQQRGIQVINVLGDAGVREKGLEQISTDGIYYLSSGIDNSRYADDSLALDTIPKDKLLLFEHVPDEQKLWWRFVDLDSLAGQ